MTAYPGLPTASCSLKTIPITSCFLDRRIHDAFVDSDYDDVSNAKVVLMANLYNYGSDVISETGQLNSKSMENADLKRQIQDRVFVITSLKNDLQKLKGKETAKNAALIPIATTIAPGMFKIDLEPLAPRLLNNSEAHIDYLKHTQEQADILRGIVEQAKTKQTLDNALDFAVVCARQLLSENEDIMIKLVMVNEEEDEFKIMETLQVLKRLRSIFTSVYAAVQKLKKALGKRLLYAKRNKAIPLEKVLLKIQQRITSASYTDYTNHKAYNSSELASLFGKLKYEENLIDSIYEAEKSKSLVSATPLSTAFFSTSIVQDFQDSLDDEEDTRNNHEYLNDLEEEYQRRKVMLQKTTDQLLKKDTKNFEAKYNKDKAKLALLAFHASRSAVIFQSKTKGLIAESYDWNEEEVLSDDEDTEVKALMALTDEERISIGKERIGQLTEDTFSYGSKDLLKELTLPKSYTDRYPSNKSQRNTTDPSAVLSDSPASDYDSADESSVCSTPLLPLKKLDGAEPGSGPKTVKSILKSKSMFRKS
ncbi:hypothetical protein Tco_1354360 [Tanacetum coccineum]